MNTNPDETTLALWLDDELTGEELAAVESWAKDHPEQLAAREDTRKWRAMMASAFPASEEPAYPDFFNSRILQAIREGEGREESPAAEPVPGPVIVPFWKNWFMPLAACAGMAMAFWIGSKTAAPTTVVEYDVTNAPKAVPVEQLVYTPDKGVNAELIASSPAAATVIVLSGVAAIPDSTDFFPTVENFQDREIDSTADITE